MRSLRADASAASWASLAALLALASGCFYNPSFDDGQFTCRQGACPAGFQCSGEPDFRCLRAPGGGPADQGPDAPTDAGDLGDTPLPTEGGSLCAADSLEPNDDQVSAVAIGAGSNLPLGLATGMATLCPGDQDWYKLEVPSGGVLISLDAANVAGLVLELRSARGEVVATGSPQGTTALVVTNSSVSGTHFVRVSGVAAATGTPYGITLETPPNDLCAGALPLTAGTSAVADFTEADHDYDPGAGGCTGRAEAGADLTYLIELAQAGRVVIHPEGQSGVTGAQAGFSMFLVQGAATACAAVAQGCVAGASNINLGESGNVLRTADPVIDKQLAAGRYYLVVSYAGSDDPNGMMTPVQVRYDLADCVTRQDCDSTVAAYCSSAFECKSPMPTAGGSAFGEFPGPTVVQPPLQLPDATVDASGNPVPGTLNVPLAVSGFGGAARVAEVQVGVTLRHPWRGDLTLSLISPPDPMNSNQTRRVVLLQNQGDNLNDVVELFGTTATPVQSLAALGDGTNAPANGTWQLEITDSSFLDQGELLDFRLFIRVR